MPTTQRATKGSPLTWTEMDANFQMIDDHLADTADAHDASAISIVDAGGYFAATDVEGALQEHMADTADAHDASAISVVDSVGAYTGTNVETVLDEIADRIGDSAGAFSFRNRIINGNMKFDQRNNGAVQTGGILTDRWVQDFSGTGALSYQQTANASKTGGHGYYLRATVTTADASLAAGDTYLIRQAIEGNLVEDFMWGTADAKTVTLSFWVRSSLTGTFSGSLACVGTATLGYAFTYAINAANTWEFKTVTIPGPTTGSWTGGTDAAISLRFDLGSGSNYRVTAGSWTNATTEVVGATGAVSLVSTLSATFDLTGVQLELGSVPTPYERRPYPIELAMCQRYFQRVGYGSVGKATAGTTGAFGIKFHVPFRDTPTLLGTYPGTAVINEVGVANRDFVSGTTGAAGTTGANVNVTTSAGMTAGNIIILMDNSYAYEAEY